MLVWPHSIVVTVCLCTSPSNHNIQRQRTTHPLLHPAAPTNHPPPPPPAKANERSLCGFIASMLSLYLTYCVLLLEYVMELKRLFFVTSVRHMRNHPRDTHQDDRLFETSDTTLKQQQTKKKKEKNCIQPN